MIIHKNKQCIVKLNPRAANTINPPDTRFFLVFFAILILFDFLRDCFLIFLARLDNPKYTPLDVRQGNRIKNQAVA